MLNSDYSIQLKNLMDSTLYEIFDFDMPFYCEDATLKKEWQCKFLRKYAFYDIGHETAERWKWQLIQKLEEVMPYYQQLYITELKSKNIEFLLNKDYTETYERAVQKDTEQSGYVSKTSDATSTSKVSDINNGIADVGLTQGKLTGMSQETGDSESTQTTTASGNGNENESYTLVGKGNIGTTSSAELLAKWREVLINIDKMLLDECRELFMTIY